MDMKVAKNRCRELAEFVVGLKFSDIPQDVVHKEKIHLLDGIGNGLYGSASPFGALVKRYLARLPSKPEALVWGTSQRVGCAEAAFANGSFSNYAELEDAHHRTKFKPNTCLTPAAIAVAELLGSSGKDVLAALIAANEICLRIATATHVGKEGYARGWIGTSSMGGFGAAALTGKLMGFGADQMAHAISLAGAQPIGIWSGGMAMSKRVLIGKAAENGIKSAFMAAEGITGGYDVFDGDWGNIGDIISTAYEPEILTRKLGEEWMTREIGLEVYPTKGGVHSAIDCVLDILKQEPSLDPENIEKILVRSTTGIAGNKAFRLFPPKDFYEAQNSLAFILAATLFDRKCTDAQFTDDKIADERFLRLGAKITTVPDAEADRLAPKTKTTFVDITMKGGRMLTSRVDYCKGEPENFLTQEELEDKFRAAARAVLDEKRMAEVISAAWGLDKLAQFSQLTRLLDA